MDNKTYVSFSTALDSLKQGKKASRLQFRDTCYIVAQYPDANSKMTKPYLVMVKGNDIFPVDLSCESIFADDWYILD